MGNKVSWTSPSGEKLIHYTDMNGNRNLLYGQPDQTGAKLHGHAVIEKNGIVIFNRNPAGE